MSTPESHAYRAPDLLINGQWREGRSAQRLPLFNPATGTQHAELALASLDDLNDSLTATAAAFDVWKRMPAQARCQAILAGVRRMRADVEQIALLLTLEQGKPLAEARAETLNAADLIEWYAQEAPRAYGRLIPGRQPDSSMAVHKQPVGPVAAFSPWNFPLVLSARKIGGALAAGCSIILKAAEETPASVAAMVRCLAQDLPPGTLQLVYGNPAEVSSVLIASPVIRKVSFTGSVAVGRHLASLAAQQVKPITLELGGHAPVIIWEDANLERAVAMLALHKFRNAGQACLSPTRFFVHRSLYARFTDAFAEACSRLRLGDGTDAATTMGPLTLQRRLDAVDALVTDAQARGARLVCGGRVEREGWFYAPTILADVPAGAHVLQDEPFGPLATITAIDSLDEALTLANNTRYGLAGYLFSDSASVIHRVTEELEVGALAVNHIAVSVPEAPFGGVKDSGYGSESGTEGLAHYLKPKFVHFASAPR